MQVKEGAVYRQRNDRYILIKKQPLLTPQEIDQGFKFLGSDGTLYSDNGKFLQGIPGGDGRDLVECVGESGYNLFLDDERNPEHVTWINIGAGPWVIVREQHQFEKTILELGIPETISFDNDLGINNGEGRYCARWLVEAVLDGKLTWKPFTFHVHSMNNVAADAIKGLLNPFLKEMKNRSHE